MWKSIIHKKTSIKNPVLIEGLPGIANVGKIVVDYMIEELEADLLRTYFSHDLPNTVFVNEENLVELPKLGVFHKKVNGQDFLFLAGDVQPKGERASFEFTEKLLDETKKAGLKEIVTIGGVGYSEPPSEIKVYCTGNDKSFVDTFEADKDIYGVVGPIIGITGLLIGLSKQRNVKGGTLLAETYNHPMHLGIREAKEVLKILNKKYNMGISFKEIDKEIDEQDNKKEQPNIHETSYIG